jgi:hypothetical protein
MNEATNELNELFASEPDRELCDAIHHVLDDQRLANSLKYPPNKWPHPWAALWSVWRHYWIWMNDGFESLWAADLQNLSQFQSCLVQIGDDLAGEFLQRALQEVGLERLQDQDFVYSAELRQLAKSWDKDGAFFFDHVQRKAARFVRSERASFQPLLNDLKTRIAMAKMEGNE